MFAGEDGAFHHLTSPPCTGHRMLKRLLAQLSGHCKIDSAGRLKKLAGGVIFGVMIKDN